MDSEPPPLSTGRRQADLAATARATERHRQLLSDFAQRADEGILIHLPVWLMIGWMSGLAESHPGFCALNGAIFFVNMAARLTLRPRFAALATRRPARATAVYLTLLLGNALHWGLLSAAAVGWNVLEGARLPLWITTAAVAASGTMALAILPIVRIAYPLATLAPIFLSMLLQFDRQSAFLSIALVGFFAYMFRASNAVQQDYRVAADLRSRLEQRARDLERLSATDSLTRIWNRRHFDDRLVTEWAAAEREQRPLTVLMIDVDHFKRINDAHGHAFGDACLRAIAAALQSALRNPNDTLARYGGEEFAALLPDTARPAATAVAERMRERVAALVIENAGLAVPLACSIGLFTGRPCLHEVAARAVERADQALYAAKAQGRNCVVAAGDAPLRRESSP